MPPSTEPQATSHPTRGSTRIFVLGDSLTYHGPQQAERPSDERLWPQHLAATITRATGGSAQVDLAAGLGWTARDGWWALTKDPRCWGELLPNADAMVVALGGMDQLPAAIPTYLREGIAVVRPGPLRRVVRRTYQASAPSIMRLTRGKPRQLPQAATDRYLSRIVTAVRMLRPEIPLVTLTPSPFQSRYYPTNVGHEPARVAALAWAARTHVDMVDIEDVVWPGLQRGSANPDGLHWGWATHAAVGEAVAARLLAVADQSGARLR